jgi:hypothetical protein
MRWLEAAFKRWIANVLFGILPSQRLLGFRLMLLASDADNELAKERIAAALGLLESTSTVFYRRVVRYVKQIVVWPGPYTAAVGPRTVQLSTAHLDPVDALELASVLVHEATHLKIGAWRIPYDDEHRERIERLCIKEQTAFLRSAGGDGIVMAEILEERLANPWWTAEAHKADLLKLRESSRELR